MYDVPIVFEITRLSSFYPHRAILLHNDEIKQLWKIKGVWKNKKTDTIIMGSSGCFANLYFDGHWFLYTFNKYQTAVFQPEDETHGVI
jgi:hypothetical protein